MGRAWDDSAAQKSRADFATALQRWQAQAPASSPSPQLNPGGGHVGRSGSPPPGGMPGRQLAAELRKFYKAARAANASGPSAPAARGAVAGGVRPKS